MDSAKLFLNGRSQAVRLPKEYAFTGDSVHIVKVDDIVMLIPKGSEWDAFEHGLSKFTDDFLSSGRAQKENQEREGLD